MNRRQRRWIWSSAYRVYHRLQCFLSIIGRSRRLVTLTTLLLLMWGLWHLDLSMSPEAHLVSLIHVPAPSTTAINASTVVFYHIYLPPSTAGLGNAHRIIESQLDQLPQDWPILYTIIGHCTLRLRCQERGLDCQQIGYYAAGFESLTLAPLHQYCVDHPWSRVVYIHSKGSFHSQGGQNERWRAAMMRAVVAPSCHQRQCDVCGLLLQPLWTIFYPGNMWTADCRYVAQLPSPTVFAQQLANIVKDARHDFDWTLFPTHSDGYVGLGRYADEHWIASHPAARLCDQSATPNLEYWWNTDTPMPLQWAPAPRFDIQQDWFRLNHSLLQAVADHSREYFLLPGLLLRWWRLHGQAPPDDSWVWTWYPQGERYRGLDNEAALRALWRNNETA